MSTKHTHPTLTYPLAILISVTTSTALADSHELEPIEQLGKKIFFDENLSIKGNQACATCHVPEVGWVGDDPAINEHGAVYEGSVNGKFGDRKPPSSAYASLAPLFYADFGNRLLEADDQMAELAHDPLFVGGNFWDGRATGWELGNPAADQAQGPFLNPVEQALPDAACVVYRVCEGRYGDLFDQVWGTGACAISWPQNINGVCRKTDGVVAVSTTDRDRVDSAYDRVALSIAAFEASDESNAFTSRIDAHRAGLYEFTKQEKIGRDIFRGKGMCSACHVGAPGPGAAPPLFTDFTYDNLGVPRNPENPFSVANPEWRDPGLEGFLKTVAGYVNYADSNLGKQKVPTLRNVGLGSCEALAYTDDGDRKDRSGRSGCVIKAYMHNGFFKSLKSVVHFYNTRDTKASCESLKIFDATEEVALANDCWPVPEVAENINVDELGNLGLTKDEEDALVAFMLAMSDGYMTSGRDDDDNHKGRDDD